jgi:hypothetical protein
MIGPLLHLYSQWAGPYDRVMNIVGRVEILGAQTTLDLIVLRTLAGMGPWHAYRIASRLKEER